MICIFTASDIQKPDDAYIKEKYIKSCYKRMFLSVVGLLFFTLLLVFITQTSLDDGESIPQIFKYAIMLLYFSTIYAFFYTLYKRCTVNSLVFKTKTGVLTRKPSLRINRERKYNYYLNDEPLLFNYNEFQLNRHLGEEITVFYEKKYIFYIEF